MKSLDPPDRLPTSAELKESFAVMARDVRIAWSAFQRTASSVVGEIDKGFRWLDDHQAEIKRFLEDSKTHRGTAWRYVIDLVDPFSGMTIAFTLQAGRQFGWRLDDGAAHVMERAFTEPQLLSEMHEAIGKSTLSATHRSQLDQGLDFVAAEKYELAVPLLINALEGAFWHIAQERGVVERTLKGDGKQGKFRTTEKVSPTPKRIDSVEGLLKLSALDLDPALVRFAATLAYGGSGNDFRHGTATDGWHLRSMFLVAALLGLLDAIGDFDALRAVRAAAMRRHRDEDHVADAKRADREAKLSAIED